jgi:hypothetical protein
MKFCCKEKNIKIYFVKWRCLFVSVLFVAVVGAQEWNVSDKYVKSWITRIQEKMFNSAYVNPFFTTGKEEYEYYAYSSPASRIPTYQQNFYNLPVYPSTITTKPLVYKVPEKIQSTTSLPIVFETSPKKLPTHQSQNSKHVLMGEFQKSKVRFTNPSNTKSNSYPEDLRYPPRHPFCRNHFHCAKQTYKSTTFMETLYYPRHPYPQNPYKSSSFHTATKTIKPIRERPENLQETIASSNHNTYATYYVEHHTPKSNPSPPYRHISILPFYLVYET